MKRIWSVILTAAIMLSMITIVQGADFSGGGYNIVCADGDRYLNVYAGRDADGVNVCVWEKDGSPEQKFTISSCGGGKYKLYPSSSSSRVIDVNRGNSYNNPLKAGLNVDLWQTNDAPAQEFYIIHVGNNLYKIELAALSGHVLQANNPNKNNGNVTLEKYTGASNQHWKILKNGTQVMERCNHDNVSKTNEKTSFERKNDGTHIVIKTYDKVCKDCGETVEEHVRNSTTENHTFSDNRCSKCGYEKPIEICNHDKTYDEVKSRNLKQKDDVYHTVTDVYDVYCSSCKELIKKDKSRSYDETHSFTNNKCTECGYQIRIEEKKCEHAKIYEKVKSFTVSQKDEANHTVTEIYDIYCSECEEMLKKNLTRTYDEKHSLKDDKCTACEYKNPVEEQCKHEETFIVDSSVTYGYMDDPIKVKDDEYHICYFYADEYCLKCKALVNKKIVAQKDEYHAYRVDTCTICLHKKVMEKPGTSTPKVSKTDFTPGEKISLTWTEAERATEYDIHIEIPGVDEPYRIDGGFTGTNGSVTINDEGTYRLTMYPINSGGYTRGGSVTVTVQKALSERTGYVYNTDGANLNIRSQANAKSAIVAKIPAGATVKVTGNETNGFYPVKYGSYTGYASSAYITFTNLNTATSDNLNYSNYVWPSSGGYLIYVLDYYYGSRSGGIHPTKGNGSIKGAIDIATTGNALATADGTVIEAKYGYNYGWGNNVTIRHNDGTYSFYAHLSKINVSVNQKVSAGQAIGVIGTTGNSTGVHLHFEIWDSTKKTIYTINAFKEKYKKQLVYDGDIVTGGSNSSEIKSWIQNNYKMSSGRWYCK